MTRCYRLQIFPVCALALMLLPPPARSQTPIDPEYEQALVHLCRVWGLAKYHHPALQQCTINWDAVLLRTVPLLKNAADESAIRTELLTMLDFAGEIPDPGTSPPQFSAEERMLYDVGWIDEPFYSGALGDRLHQLCERARIKAHCMVESETGTNKPVFDKDDRFYDPLDPYPPEEYRVLAFCRYWNCVQYFYPYRDIMDRDWNEVLRDRVAEWSAAADPLAYHTAVLRTSSDLCDAHGFVYSDLATEFLGLGMAPFTASHIDTDVVIDHSIQPGIAQGDIIREMDGIPIAKLMDSVAQYSFNTNPTAFSYSILERICRGPIGNSTVVLENAEGLRTETFFRTQSNFGIRRMKSHAPIIDTILPDGSRFGYVDMDFLQKEEVHSVMTQFRDADAIVFDIRGYPAGTVWTLADYILPRYTPVARFSAPRASYAGMLEWKTLSFGGQGGWTYEGTLIVLMNESTLSQAEYTCMFFKAAPNCIFIGSPTRGSDGNVTYVYLPGGLRAMFTGLGVFYPDGRPTQRVGIQPDILVRPTLSGFRAGRDEVFEAAFDPGLLAAEELPAHSAALRMFLSPDPGLGDVTCTITGNVSVTVSIEIVDAIGRTRYARTIDINGGITLRLATAGLPRGMYFVRAMPLRSSDGPAVTERFVRY